MGVVKVVYSAWWPATTYIFPVSKSETFVDCHCSASIPKTGQNAQRVKRNVLIIGQYEKKHVLERPITEVLFLTFSVF